VSFFQEECLFLGTLLPQCGTEVSHPMSPTNEGQLCRLKLKHSQAYANAMRFQDGRRPHAKTRRRIRYWSFVAWKWEDKACDALFAE